MAFESEIIAGHAELLAAASVGEWSPTGTVYTPGVTGIYDSHIPEDADRLICLTTYSVVDMPVGPDSVLGLQVRTRMPGPDPRPCRDLDGDIFDLLQERAGYTVGTVRISQCLRQSSTSLGQDNSARWSWSSNYYLTLARPGQHRF